MLGTRHHIHIRWSKHTLLAHNEVTRLDRRRIQATDLHSERARSDGIAVPSDECRGLSFGLHAPSSQPDGADTGRKSVMTKRFPASREIVIRRLVVEAQLALSLCVAAVIVLVISLLLLAASPQAVAELRPRLLLTTQLEGASWRAEASLLPFAAPTAGGFCSFLIFSDCSVVAVGRGPYPTWTSCPYRVLLLVLFCWAPVCSHCHCHCHRLLLLLHPPLLVLHPHDLYSLRLQLASFRSICYSIEHRPPAGLRLLCFLFSS